MRTYRILTPDGRELLLVKAPNVIDLIADRATWGLPPGAEIVSVETNRVLARLEQWLDGAPGWSLIPGRLAAQ